MIKHIDLFSGIGGFALAVDEVFGKSEHIFCEIDPYCQALLKKRFEGAMIYGDIRTLSRERLATDTNGNGQPRGSEEINTAETGQQTFGNVEECYGATADTESRQSGVEEAGDRGQDISRGSEEGFILSNGNGQPRGSEEINTAKAGQQTLGNAEECYGVVTDTKHNGEFRAKAIRKDSRTQSESKAGEKLSVNEPKGTGSIRTKEFGWIDILTGGFPCQPFSQAGKRKGTDDNRYLWPEMLRVIRDFQPTWVIAENVRGILTIEQGMVFEQVCLDLEGAGYEVQTFVIPAVAKNAPHRRDRVWFVANRSDRGCGRGLSEQQGGDDEQQIHTAEEKQARDDLRSETFRCSGCDRQDAPDTDSKRSRTQGYEDNSNREKGNEGWNGQPFNRIDGQGSWNQNWLEVATELCGVDDGLPAELDGLKLSKSRHRVERLKALGNAIVPQVAVEIMYAIRNTTKGGK